MDQKLISLPNYDIKQLLGSGSFDKKLIQNIVFEYMETNLEDMIFKDRLSFPNFSVKSIGKQILEGLKHMHKKNISHRDLKPENVLISGNTIKICDFGLNTPYIVSRYYRSPELLLGICKYTISIDIWATACILAELVLSTPLFTAKSEGEQIFKIFSILGMPDKNVLDFWKKEVPFDPKLIDKFPVFEGKNLKKCFANNKSIKQLDNFVDLLEKMLDYDFYSRITAEKALQHPFFNE